jgi:hypothetical protein
MWEPLFAIAAKLGAPWISRITRAAKVLTTRADFDEPDPRIQLLGDIYNLLTEMHAPKRILSAELLEKLRKSEARNYQGRALDNQKSLATMLQPFGISTKTLRVGPTQGRAYDTSEFDDAFKRYLRLDPPGAPAKPAKMVAKAPSKATKARTTRTTRTATPSRSRAVKASPRKLTSVPTFSDPKGEK